MSRKRGGQPGNANAVKHGLTATLEVRPEDTTVYDLFARALVAELEPVGAVEEYFARRVVAAAWRLLRCERLEAGMGSATVGELVAEAVRDRARPGVVGLEWVPPDRARATAYLGLATLARYEGALERVLFRNLAALDVAQQRRREREQPQKPGPGFVAALPPAPAK